MAASVVKVGVATPLGDSPEELFSNLMAGRSSIASHQRFPCHTYVSDVGSFFLGQLEAKTEGWMMTFLLERLLKTLGPVPRDTQLILASTKGVNQALETGGHCKSPGTLTAAYLLSALEEKLNLDRPGIQVSAACASSTVALARAVGWIAEGLAQSVLVIGADVITEFIYAGFSSLQALSAKPARPFDKNRNGLSLGDGAAALLLFSEKRVEATDSSVLGKITGYGLSNDATHVTAPDREGEGLVLALEKALQRAGVSAEEVGGVLAHGTGTVYNDQMEMQAFNKVFNYARPTCSIKGALGHTLAAAGALEAIVGLSVLREGALPPTAGLRTVDPLAAGWVLGEATQLQGLCLVSTNSGFGGVNAALVLEGV